MLESDLALVPAVEELWEGALLDGVDPVVVEPRAVRRNDDVVSLQCEVCIWRRFERGR